MKAKKLLTSWRIWLLLILVLFSLVAISPSFSQDGVVITNVELNSSASIAGIESPSQMIQPRSREVITGILSYDIKTIDDYYMAIEEVSKLSPDDIVYVTTNKQTYTVIMQPDIVYNTTNETVTVEKNVTEDNVTKTINVTEPVVIETVVGVKDLGLTVSEAPFSNIRKGLDLAGGTRVILQPEEEVSNENLDIIITNMKQRLNVYGLADIVVKETSDLSGTKFILVEIPGVNEEGVKDLISQQGKFEAKIGEEVVFAGGEDIKTVFRSADRSGIDPRYGCQQYADGSYTCRFYFGILLSEAAAARQAAETEKLSVITVDETGATLARDNHYLSKKLDFYLDDTLTESLNIGADLRGRAITEIQISGSGVGRTELEARQNTLDEMKQMQTLLITGSLPVSLKVIKTDSISPSLGKEFLDNALFVGLLVLIAVSIIVFIMYRKFEIMIPMVLTVITEMVMILGFAAAIKWNLDMAGIAGILIVVGTGVDHLIIITDETLKKTESLSMMQKLKRAFVIILAAGLTTGGAMLPLMLAGVGLLKGFAFTTLFGVTIGVLIARPAYSAAIEVLLKK